MDTKSVQNALNTVLADTYVLMLKTQNVHWNVTGIPFYAIHNLTEQQYTELFAAVDLIAERQRALGATAPGTMRQFLELTNLKEGNGGSDFSQMVQELLSANQQIADFLRIAIESISDPGTQDLFTIRLQAHEKAAWMWKSVLAQNGIVTDPTPTTNGANGSTKSATSTPKPEPKTESKPKAQPKAETKAVTAKSSGKSAKANKKKKGRVTRNVSDIG